MAMAVTMSSAAFNVAMALKTQLNFTFTTTSPSSLFNAPGTPVLALGLCVGAQRLLHLLLVPSPYFLFMFMLRSNIFGLRKMLINCDSIGSGVREGEQGQGLSWVSCLFVF